MFDFIKGKFQRWSAKQAKEELVFFLDMLRGTDLETRAITVALATDFRNKVMTSSEFLSAKASGMECRFLVNAYKYAQKERLYPLASGIAVWIHTARSDIYLSNRQIAQEMWSLLSDAFEKVEYARESFEYRSGGIELDIDGYDYIPIGFDYYAAHGRDHLSFKKHIAFDGVKSILRIKHRKIAYQIHRAATDPEMPILCALSGDWEARDGYEAAEKFAEYLLNELSAIPTLSDEDAEAALTVNGELRRLYEVYGRKNRGSFDFIYQPLERWSSYFERNEDDLEVLLQQKEIKKKISEFDIDNKIGTLNDNQRSAFDDDKR